MADLNPDQKKAVLSIEGPLLVFAGAGSGKTRVITYRIKEMVRRGISPSCIVAVTFTNKSAREMKERMKTLLPRGGMRGMVISTFHSLGNRILRKEIDYLPGYRSPYSILSPEDTLNIFTDLYRKYKLDPTKVKEDGMPFLISLCKNSGMDAFDFASSRGMPVDEDTFAGIYKDYRQSLVSLNSVDFDDLILLPTALLKENPSVLARYRSRWRYFLVDEFQDTNPVQYEFLRLFIDEKQNICVVGDDDQSIYGWRGADVGIIRNFEKDFPGAATVHLEHNYRSAPGILQAANAVIANNTVRVQKKLIATIVEDTTLRIIPAEDESDEALIVCDLIQEQIVKERRSPGDFAILFRTNFQSRVFEQELRKRQIPHHVVGGYRFFDRREVKDMIAYLRAIANPRDEISFQRIINRPKRGIGETSIKKIGEYISTFEEEKRPDLQQALHHICAEPAIAGLAPAAASAMYSFLELIETYRKQFSQARRLSPVLAALIRELDFEKEFLREGDTEQAAKARLLNLSELTNMLSYMEDNWDQNSPPTLFDFLGKISMQATDSDDDNPRGRVQLLTLHLSKGLEYPVVFLTGMESGMFPADRSLKDSENSAAMMEEERRLFYVGITRSQSRLHLTYCQTRRKFGEVLDVEPSLFLNELPAEVVEWEDCRSLSTEDTAARIMAALRGEKEEKPLEKHVELTDAETVSIQGTVYRKN